MNAFDSIALSRRATQARAVLLLAFLVLGGAFFRAQILEHDKFQLKAETNRLRPVPLTPPRGAILDFKGRVIAENTPGYTVKLLAQREDSLRAVLDRFSTVVPLTTQEVNAVVVRWRGARYQPALVYRDADFATVSKLEEHRAILPGMVIQSEPKRLYHAGPSVAHLIGYVSEVNQADLDANRYPGAQLGTIVGKAGLERAYDSILRGREGVRYVEVNARGGMVREDVEGAALAPTAGTSLTTTVDLDLQQFIDSIWPRKFRGAMVAMTPTGEIRALYSAPSFDPNLFVGGISAADYRMLERDSARPLLNRAIIGRYPPASPFKLATAAMALKRGVIDLHTHMPISCSGGFRLGNRVFKCWKKEGHGNLDLIGAVAASCDVYFYQVGLRLGLDAILEDGVLMGFRDKSGIDLPSEQSPIYPASTAYYDRRYGPRNWSAPATTLNLSIGQGENTQTLINMMKFYVALAGDGGERRPFVVPGAASGSNVRSLGLSTEQLEGLRKALIAVVQRGTAAGGTRRTLGTQVINIAGKTGTAQATVGEDHGWFIGFAPAEKPEIVVGAIFEHGLHGSDVVPYVVQTIRRYLLGAEQSPPPAAEVRVQRDSAPRVQELAPDSAIAADSVVPMTPPRRTERR